MPSPVDAAIEKNGLRVSAQGTGNLVLQVVSVKKKRRKGPTHTDRRLTKLGVAIRERRQARTGAEHLRGPRLHKSNKRNHLGRTGTAKPHSHTPPPQAARTKPY